MMIAVPFFGHDPRWLKLLERWFDLHAASRTKVPAIIISDERVNGFPHLHVDTLPFQQAMRPGHAWDRKGAIVAAAVQYLGRVLVCDLDAFVQHDPEPVMAKLPSVPFAMRQDGWARTIHAGGVSVVQRQAGVLWFGAPYERTQLAQFYRTAFGAAGTEEYAQDEWREQIAWSIMASWTGLHDLPKTLNCSHHDPEAGNACILHEHGETKWKRIARPENNASLPTTSSAGKT